MFWLAVLDVILTVLDDELEGVNIIKPTKTISGTQNESLFVDDASLIVVGQLNNVIEKLKRNEKLHKRLLVAEVN